jgi:hypothetical protein
MITVTTADAVVVGEKDVCGTVHAMEERYVM